MTTYDIPVTINPIQQGKPTPDDFSGFCSVPAYNPAEFPLGIDYAIKYGIPVDPDDPLYDDMTEDPEYLSPQNLPREYYNRYYSGKYATISDLLASYVYRAALLAAGRVHGWITDAADENLDRLYDCTLHSNCLERMADVICDIDKAHRETREQILDDLQQVIHDCAVANIGR